MIQLVAVLLLLQDKGEADRVRVANTFEQAFKARGLPRKFNGHFRLNLSLVVKDSELHAFAQRYGPANGAVLVASESGTLWALAGGSRGGEGVPVAFFGHRDGILLLAGGMSKGSPPAEALHSIGLHDLTGYYSLGDDFMVRVARGRPPAAVPTPSGDPVPAPTPVEEKLAVRGRDTVGKDLDELSLVWPDSARDRRREMALKFADAHRPATGVLACITRDGALLVMIGADGTDVHPDGMGVEVNGRTGAKNVVLIPGRAKGSGKAGFARGSDAFIVAP